MEHFDIMVIVVVILVREFIIRTGSLRAQPGDTFPGLALHRFLHFALVARRLGIFSLDAGARFKVIHHRFAQFGGARAFGGRDQI
ncbi:MAG: hypothetical protein WAV22_06230, partial [Porticoccaceae bacterium]